MNPIELEHAIRHRLQVQFTYDRQPRIVQPGALGTHVMTDKLTLRAYQVAGRSNSRTPPFWSLFTVERIADLVVTDVRFDEDPPNYRSGDRHLHPIIAELTADH